MGWVADSVGMYDALRSWLFRLDPEQAHRVALASGQVAQTLAAARIHEQYAFFTPALGQRLVDLNFSNPVGLAAGLDKNGMLLPLWGALGFGFVEVGSVTARASKGNPRPRMFRLPEDRAIINRLGLPNQGAQRIAKRINRRRQKCSFPIGISLAKTHSPEIVGDEAIHDYCQSLAWLGPVADYVALNISCPNTADGKTFEDPKALDRLLAAISQVHHRIARKPPIFLKLSPPPSTQMVFDSQVEEILAVGRTYGVRGYIACNTASDREGLEATPDAVATIGAGGLSGPPIRSRAMHLVRYLFNRLGPRTPIIGVGGIDSAETAYAMLRAGASLVQFYTALVYQGPNMVREIKAQLADFCDRDRLSSIREAIGADA